jgi:hypothetical protein
MAVIKMLALAAAAALVVLLAYAATRPDAFTIARSATVNAPPEKVHALINDLRAFNTWNPFDKKDPNIRGTYKGPAAGPGAHYAFQGNKEVGSGSLEIVQSEPQRVTMRLDMLEPFEAHNTVQFSLARRGNATEVTWVMDGRTPYLAKIMHIFFDVDRMVGGEFEKGLADLKSRAERT